MFYILRAALTAPYSPVRVFSVNMARSVFCKIKRLFLIFDFPILIFRTSLTQALTVFGSQITFSTPPKTFSAPIFFFGTQLFLSAPHFFFGRSQRITQPDIWALVFGPQPIVTEHFRLPTHVFLVLVRVSPSICSNIEGGSGGEWGGGGGEGRNPKKEKIGAPQRKTA